MMRSPYNLGEGHSCQDCSTRSSGFFCELSAASLRGLDSVSCITSYPPDALLFVEGQSPRGVFVVCRGQVKLSVISEDGRTLILKIAGPGEVLGLSACLKGRAYEVTAQTVSSCQVDYIKAEDVRRLLQQDGEICLRAALQMSLQYQSACRELRWVGLSRSADWKMASLLLGWAEEQSQEEASSFKMTLTHEELAQMIGTTRETVTRVLARFRKEKLIEVRGATLILSNKVALRDIAGSGTRSPLRAAAAGSGHSLPRPRRHPSATATPVTARGRVN